MTTATRDIRFQSMQQAMDKAGADAIVFSSADFIQFATNFAVDVLPWERPIFAIITRDGTINAVFNELSTNHLKFSRAKGTLWLTEDQIHSYSEHPRVTNVIATIQELPKLLASVLERMGLAGKKLICDALGPVLAAAVQALPGTVATGELQLLRSLRWVKTAEELHIMRSLAKLTDWAQERFKELYQPGLKTQVLDYQVAALIAQEAAQRFPGESFDLMRCWTLSGPASASPHGDGANVGAIIRKGDNIVNFVLPRLNGYYVENERTWFVGPPSDMQKRCFETARAATAAGVAAARTGNRVCDIDAAAFAVIRKAGLDEYVYHRTGHGVGLMLHEYPEDMAFSTRPLLANEVYSCEPGLYVYGLGGFRIDDTVVVGDTPEVLVSTPSHIEWVTLDV
ncbi:Xaa-Pro peptidase family protein [Pantoea sp. 18069]|uniref:M24 family metallopeptidase n=1 Tax=Pantoea sp. 18069 TaxID=2681415 RepID=UPI00190FA4E7|nr:M24 family metallopeptidase [Pantoea sp. 18069]